MPSNIQQPSIPIQNNNTSVQMQCPKSLQQQNAYRQECLIVLRTAIAQRSKIINARKSRLILQESHLTVFREFAALQNKWKSAGIASYIYRHAETIREIIPSSNPTLRQRFDELVNVATEYFN